MFTFPAKQQKDCRFSGSLHTFCFLCSRHALRAVRTACVNTCQPKSAAEQVSCRCNRSLLFVCLPFRNDVHFCPGEFVYIQAITRLPSRRSKRITVARQSRNLTPLPLVTLVAAYRRFDNLLMSYKVHFYEQTVNDESFLFFFSQTYFITRAT